jgi:hypothetical protein
LKAYLVCGLAMHISRFASAKIFSHDAVACTPLVGGVKWKTCFGFVCATALSHMAFFLRVELLQLVFNVRSAALSTPGDKKTRAHQSACGDFDK